MGRVQVNKAHKSRFSSKSTRNIHRTSVQGEGAETGRPFKRERAMSGSTSPPCVIVLFGLSASVDLESLAKDLLRLLSAADAGGAPSTFSSPEYKMHVTVLKAPHGDLMDCMEMAKQVHYVKTPASTTSTPLETSLSVFRSIVLPSTAVFIRDLPLGVKKQHEFKKCISGLTPEYPEDCRFYSADTEDELHKFLWLFKGQRLGAPHWRNKRALYNGSEGDRFANY